VADRFDLVIFDNDGVLVDSEWRANGILAELLCEAGLPSTRESCIAEYMGSSLTRVREIAETRLGRALPRNLEDRYHARLFEPFRPACSHASTDASSARRTLRAASRRPTCSCTPRRRSASRRSVVPSSRTARSVWRGRTAPA